MRSRSGLVVLVFSSMPTDIAPAARTRQNLLAALTLCLVTLVVYSNSFQAGFTLDNRFILQQDRFHAATLHNAGLIFRHTYWWPVAENGLYRPLTSLSYLLNYAIAANADRPEGYHWINAGLQCGNVVLAFFLVLRLMRRFWPAFFVAGIWAVHPLLTESVTNIVGRADLLSGFAVLGGVLVYLKSTESTGGRRLGCLVGLAASTAIGIFSKESSIAIVGVIAIVELTWWKGSDSIRNLIDGFVATLIPVGMFLVQRSAVLAAARPAFVAFADNPLVGAGFWTAHLTVIRIMVEYLGLIFWPAKLSADYSWAQIPLATGTWEDWLACSLVLALLVSLALLYRFSDTSFFFGCFALLTFLPGSNLLFRIGTIMAERLLYLPSLGVIACVVLAVYAVAARVRGSLVVPVVLIGIMVALGSRAWTRNLDWRSDLSLAQSAVEVSPRSFKSHLLLASALAEAGNVGPALLEAERSLAILDSLPNDRNVWSAYRQSADWYLLEGDRLRPLDPARSAQAYRRATDLLERAILIVRASPLPIPHDGGLVLQRGASDCYRALSVAWLRLSDPVRAREAALHARDLDPSTPDSWLSLAHATRAAGNHDEEIQVLMEGQLLVGGLAIDRDIVAFYGDRVPNPGCAFFEGLDGPHLNRSCGIVHKPLCAAALEAVRFLLQTNQPEMARDMASKAVSNLNCEADQLRGILTGH